MPKASKNKAAINAASVCSICESNPIKYHCPVDRVGYCSVPCFKKHKAEFCISRTTTTVPTSSFIPTTPAPSESEEIPVQSTSLQTDEKQAPIISLASLMWPPDPEEEGLNALNDPLNRNEPKPLLHSDLLAIATSVPLRQLLSTHPFLKTVLTNLSRIPNNPPKFPQANRVKDILGLGEESGVPNVLYYRPGEETDSKRSKASATCKRHDPISNRPRHINVDENERSALLEFNELVKKILAEERKRRSTLQVN